MGSPGQIPVVGLACDVRPRPHRALRLWIAASSVAGEGFLALAGLRPIRALPEARAPEGDPPSTTAGLWQRLPAPPASPGSAGRTRSGLWTTLRAIRGDLARKQLDQVPGLAGQGAPPSGFAAETAPPSAPGRAPLAALLHPPAPGRPIVFLLHGLFDSKLTGYVRRAAEALIAGGCGVLVPDLRWHGALLSPDWPPGLGISEAADLLAWGRRVGDRHPGHPLGLLGFSLGTTTLIHTLADPAAAQIFRAGGIAISPPGASASTLPYLDRTGLLARPLGCGLMPVLFRFALRQRMARVHPGLPRHPPFRSLLAFLAERSPTPVTPEELVAASDHLEILGRVERPLLLLASENDPIFPPGTVAELAAAAAGNPRVRLLVTPEGGHVGQMAAYPQWSADLLAVFYAWSWRV